VHRARHRVVPPQSQRKAERPKRSLLTVHRYAKKGKAERGTARSGLGRNQQKGHRPWAPGNDARARPSAFRRSHHQLSSPTPLRILTHTQHWRLVLGASAPLLPFLFGDREREREGSVTRKPQSPPPPPLLRPRPPTSPRAFRRANR